MINKVELQSRLAFWKSALEKLQKAYLALVDGSVKSYRIDDKELTRLDLPELSKEIEAAQKKVDELTALLGNQRPRKAFGVIPMDF